MDDSGLPLPPGGHGDEGDPCPAPIDDDQAGSGLDLYYACQHLLSPPLIEYCGLYFRRDQFSESVFDEWREAGCSDTEIQRVINELRIFSFMHDEDIAPAVALAFRDLIASSWTTHFAQLPVRVLIYGDEILTAAVTFHNEL